MDTLAELSRIRDALLQAGALVGASDHQTTRALYARDPDGLEVTEGTAMTAPLHLEREIERYGAHTRGGVCVSIPA